jgi:hypothetical protein
MSAPRRSGETGTTAATRTACPRPAIPATAIAVERREETPRQASPRQEQGGGHRRPPRQQTPWTHHPRARSSGSRASRSRRCTTGGSGESSDDATKIRRRHSSTDAPPLRPLQRHPYLQNAVTRDRREQRRCTLRRRRNVRTTQGQKIRPRGPLTSFDSITKPRIHHQQPWKSRPHPDSVVTHTHGQPSTSNSEGKCHAAAILARHPSCAGASLRRRHGGRGGWRRHRVWVPPVSPW